MEYDEFDEWKKTKTTVYEILDDGDFFSCSCPSALKKILLQALNCPPGGGGS